MYVSGVSDMAVLKIFQNVALAFFEGISSVAVNKTLSLTFIDLEKATHKHRTLWNIVCAFSFGRWDVLNTFHRDPIIATKLPYEFFLFLVFMPAGTFCFGQRSLEIEGRVVCEQNRRCTVDSVGPNHGHDTVGVFWDLRGS